MQCGGERVPTIFIRTSWRVAHPMGCNTEEDFAEGDYAKWNKPEERQIPAISLMWTIVQQNNRENETKTNSRIMAVELRI